MTEIRATTAGTVKNWKRSGKSMGKLVAKGEKLVSIMQASGLEVWMVSKFSGKISSIIQMDGVEVEEGDVLCVMDPCNHPVLFNDMCAACGEKPVSSTNSSVELSMYRDGKIKVSEDEACRIMQAKIENLKQSKRLALVLDLDHTLLHACEVRQLPSPHELEVTSMNYIHLIDEVALKDSHEVVKVVKHHLVKLRPHCMNFLEQAHAKYQLTIYTAGTRKYADAIANLLDPTKRLFGNRIVSRSDNPGDPTAGHSKTLRKLFPDDTSIAVIIDDNENVWKDEADQLLLVKPFEYFRGIREVNNAPGMTASGGLESKEQAEAVQSVALAGPLPGHLLVATTDQFPDPASHQYNHAALMDDQLARCGAVLDLIHSRYYGCPAEAPAAPSSASAGGSVGTVAPRDTGVGISLSGKGVGLESLQKDVDVESIMRDLMLTVLRGCNIVFSVMFPRNGPVGHNEKVWWRLARCLGATVATDIGTHTTHVLALSRTPKVEAALLRGDVWVVHPDWLKYCRWALSRVREETFVVLQQKGGKFPADTLVDRSAPLLPPLTDADFEAYVADRSVGLNQTSHTSEGGEGRGGADEASGNGELCIETYDRQPFVEDEGITRGAAIISGGDAHNERKRSFESLEAADLEFDHEGEKRRKTDGGGETYNGFKNSSSGRSEGIEETGCDGLSAGDDDADEDDDEGMFFDDGNNPYEQDSSGSDSNPARRRNSAFLDGSKGVAEDAARGNAIGEDASSDEDGGHAEDDRDSLGSKCSDPDEIASFHKSDLDDDADDDDDDCFGDFDEWVQSR